MHPYPSAPTRTGPAPSRRPEQAVLEAICVPASPEQVRELLPPLLIDPAFRWGELLERAIEHKVLSLLADTVKAADLTRYLPPRLWRFMDHALRCNQYKNAIYRTEASRMAAAAQAAGVAFTAVKGIAVESTLYGGRGGRQFSDIDLLICPDGRSACAELLAGLGYQPGHPDASRRTVVPLPARKPTATTYTRLLDDIIVPSVSVDLTVRLPTDGPGDAMPMRHLLAGRKHQQIPGHPEVALPVLENADHLLFMLLTLQGYWSRSDQAPRLSLYADALRLIAAVPSARRGELAELVAALGLERSVAAALARLQQAFPHAPLGSEAHVAEGPTAVPEGRRS